MLAGAVLALGLVSVSLWYALSARADLGASLQRLADAEAWEREAVRLEREYATWQDWQEGVRAFRQSLAARDLDRNRWRVRSLTIEREVMSRERAGAYMGSLVHREGYLFLPREFTLRVMHDGDGLLRWRPGNTDDLEMTLAGDYLIRRQP